MSHVVLFGVDVLFVVASIGLMCSWLALLCQSDAKRLESQLRVLEEDLKKANRDHQDAKMILEEREQQSSLLQAQLEKERIESKQQLESTQQELQLTQKEAQEESKEKQKEQKLRASLEQRVEELEWYFLPFEQQQEKESLKDFSTPALQLLKRSVTEYCLLSACSYLSMLYQWCVYHHFENRMKKEQMAELEEIRKRHSKRIVTIEGIR